MKMRSLFTALLAVAIAALSTTRAPAQAALLMQQPYGLARVFNSTGHEAIYFARICADTPMRLRRCGPNEMGAVISRYNGIGGYDWLAVPLIPYLYAVDDAKDVPAQVDRATVNRLRRTYHDKHLQALGPHVPEGGLIRRGWNQLSGVAYNRGIYVFRFDTTEAQDDAFIARMNAAQNRSHFHILTSNCANFADSVLDFYFPHTFGRRLLPDAGIVTPRQTAYELDRYAQKHPELRLAVFEIPQVPGYRKKSLQNKSVAEAFIVSGDIVPVAVLCPYAAAGLAADYLAWGRYPLPLRGAPVLGPRDLAPLEQTAEAMGSE